MAHGVPLPARVLYLLAIVLAGRYVLPKAIYALRRLRPDVRVILSSGYSEQVALRRFGETGIAGFIQKPYRPSNLLQEIREILETR